MQDLLFGSDGLNLQYDEQRTQTAIEVFQSRAGNCLSVMNLYVAGCPTPGYRRQFSRPPRSDPSGTGEETLVVLSDHINATGELSPFVDYVVDFTPDLALQQSSLQTVSDRKARALYFNNLGVEALIAHDDDMAQSYLRNALWLQPELAIAWNNMGTAYNRSGQADLAEYSYQMSIYLEVGNATAIGNLARLYEARGDNREAARLRQSIAEFNRVNPYYQFELGNFAFMDGQFDEAIRYYRRAIKLG